MTKTSEIPEQKDEVPPQEHCQAEKVKSRTYKRVRKIEIEKVLVKQGIAYRKEETANDVNTKITVKHKILFRYEGKTPKAFETNRVETKKGTPDYTENPLL